MDKTAQHKCLSNGWQGTVYRAWDFSQEVIDGWDDLVQYYGDIGVFISYGWFESWWKAFGKPLELFVVVLSKDGLTKAIFPCCIKSAPIKGIKGDYIASLTNDHTCHYDFIIDPEHRQMALSKFLKLLSMIRPHRQMYFECMPSAEGNISFFNKELHCKRMPVHVVSDPRTPWLDVSTNIDVLMVKLPGKFKYNLRRRYKKAETMGELKLEIIHHSKQLDRVLDTIFEIEFNSWKGKNGTAIKSQPEVESFYKLLAYWGMKQNHLLVFILKLDNKPIAADLCLYSGQSVFLLKQGYDETFKNISPGKLLRFDVLSYLYETPEISIYNLLGDCEPWKLELTQNIREYDALIVYPKTLMGWSQYIFNFGWKTFLKKFHSLNQLKEWKEGLRNKQHDK